MSDEAAPISGSIDPRTFPLVLMSLHRNGVTGSLKVDGPTYQKALYFRSGRILFGSSNDPRDELGSILIVAGKLTAEQLADVKARVGPGNPLAKALQDSGFVSQREIGEAARGKVEQILADVLGYDVGSFEFEDGVLPKGAIDLKLSTPKLVLAAARRATERAFVLRHLDSLDAVLAPGAADAGEVRADAGALLGLLDGTRSLKDAAAAASLDEFEAAKIACGLLFLGVLENRGATPGLGATDAALDLNLSTDETPLFAAPEPQRDTTSQTMMLPSPFASVRPAELGEETAEPSLEATLDETFSRLNSADVEKSFAAMREAEAAAAMEEPESAPEVDAALDIAPAPEPEPPPPAAPRASKAELAAIDGLLKDKPATEGPLTPFERRSWEPEFPSKPTSGQPRRPQAGRRSRSSPALALGLGGVALIAAGAVWYFFAGPGSAPPPAPAPPTTVAAARPSPTPAEPAVSPADATGDVAAPPAVAAASGPSPASAKAPAAATPASAPPTTIAAKPTATPARPGTPPTTPAPAAPAPAAAKAAPPAAQKPAPATAKPAPGGRPGWPEATAAMRRGDVDNAAKAYAQAARASGKTWTTQVLVACSKETVTKAAAAISSDDLFVVPVRYQKKDCYRVLWGLADSEAQAAATEIPGYFKAGGAAPKAVTLRSALP
jgi:hypothetical protein